MTDANYAYTPAQAEFLLHSLEQAAGNIDLYMNLPPQKKQQQSSCV